MDADALAGGGGGAGGRGGPGGRSGRIRGVFVATSEAHLGKHLRIVEMRTWDVGVRCRSRSTAEGRKNVLAEL